MTTRKRYLPRHPVIVWTVGYLLLPVYVFREVVIAFEWAHRDMRADAEQILNSKEGS